MSHVSRLSLILILISLWGCRQDGVATDSGAASLASAPGDNAISPNSLVSSGVFQPTEINRTPAPGAAPDGMVWIPGGEFSLGANDPPDMDHVGMKATLDSRPIHRVYVDGFYMDKTDVTNSQFARFVKATGYVTVAERTPRAEDFPGAPSENLAAGSVVFSPPDHPVLLNDHFQWWSYVHGADWRHPIVHDRLSRHRLPGLDRLICDFQDCFRVADHPQSKTKPAL